jgi:hypothetical protein
MSLKLIFKIMPVGLYVPKIQNANYVLYFLGDKSIIIK